MKGLFNSIIRTMYSGCYYKKGSRVIYLYDIKQTGDSFVLSASPNPSTSLILSLSLDMRTISIRDASAAFIAKQPICSQM